MTTTTDVSGPTLAATAGITYRQLDYWTRHHWITPNPQPHTGSGYHRTYPHTQVELAHLMRLLIDDGLTPQAAHRHATNLQTNGHTHIAGKRITHPTEGETR